MFVPETVTGQGCPAALQPCPALPARAGRNIFFKPCPGSPAGQGRATFFALLTFLLKIVIHRDFQANNADIMINHSISRYQLINISLVTACDNFYDFIGYNISPHIQGVPKVVREKNVNRFFNKPRQFQR